MNKNLAIINAVLALVAIALIVWLVFKVTPKETEIYFYKDSELISEGEVFLDSESLGNITENKKIRIPKESCGSAHTLKLVSGGEEYEFAFYPIDCSYSSINYTATKETIEIEKRPEQITFDFVDENKKPFPGALYFDNSYQGEINGKVVLQRSRCKSISKILIIYGSANVTWDNNPDLCSEKDVLEFMVKKSEIGS
jgi:hypothetical protein